MTEPNWQGDMLRRIAAEQSPAEQPAHPDNPPAPADAAPVGEQPAVQEPAPPVEPPLPPQQPPFQQYEQQPPPPYAEQPYGGQQPSPEQQPYAEQPPPQFPQQPYGQQQYPEQQYYPPQPPPQPPYPPQGYQQPPPYQPGPYDQQYAPPPPPPQQYEQPQYAPPPGQVAPYQPAPYEQYPPPYEPYPPYEQQPPHPQPPYPTPQYEDPQYPPHHQQHPGQAPYQDPAQYQPPPGPDASWGPPPPTMTPQSDQLGTPLPPEQQGTSVFRRFRRFASEAAYLVGASGRMQRDVDHIATIRRPIAIMRRIGVLSPVTNGGTSTVTALLSTMLATQRSDRVVAVDVDPSGAELSRRLEQTIGSGPIEGVSLVRSEGTADAVRTTLAGVQGQGARDVCLAVVDCPGNMYDDVGSEMAASGHCAVVVIPSVEHVANYCLAQLDQLTPEGQDVLLTRGVMVITVVQNVDPGSVRWLVDALNQRGLDPVVLPYDAHIAQSWPLRSEKLQAGTRRAVLDLAARVVETVTGTAS